MMMNAKEIAAALNGTEYGDEDRKHGELFKSMKANGFVAVFGYSDDNMEFRGAIYDEVGCWEGGKSFVKDTGLITNECEDGDGCPYFPAIVASARTITANWDSDGYSWTYSTDIPHETFDVIDEGEPYCRGIVFALSDAA